MASEEDKAEIAYMGFMDLAFSVALENEGEDTSSMFQEMWWHQCFLKCEKWQKAF